MLVACVTYVERPSLVYSQEPVAYGEYDVTKIRCDNAKRTRKSCLVWFGLSYETKTEN